MSEQTKKVETVEEAAEQFARAHDWPIDYSIFGPLNDGFIAGVNWKQSDPAFIAQVVEKALGIVKKMAFDSKYYGNTDRDGILALKDEIVNQIINSK